MRKITLLFLFFFVVSLLLPFKASAQSNFRSREVVILEKEEVVNDNYFAAGELVNVLGTINGDTYLAGGNLIVEGIINGDLLAVGGNITIKGSILGNVRVVGGQLNISGNIAKNITAVGGQITILDNAVIGGNLTAAGGNIEVNAPLGGSLTAAGGSLTIANTVPGNLNYAGDKLWLSPSASVMGNINYFSEKDAQISGSASVSGTVVKHSPPEEALEARESAKSVGPKLMSLWTVISFISALILGYLLTRYLPNFSLKVADQIKTRFLPNLGLGFLVLVLVPVAALSLLITIVGIPIAFISMFGYFLLMYLSKLIAAVYLGQMFVARFMSKKGLFLTFAIGLTIFYLLGILPLLGKLTQFILSLTAIGALLTEKKAAYLVLSKTKVL